MKRIALLAVVPLLLANAASLDVTVTGIKNRNGQLLACLWRDKGGFPICAKSKTSVKQRLTITGGTMKIAFRNLTPGSYAVSIEHDEDGDGKLKTNFIGIPKEGVGMSNNPGGIPGWGKAQVRVPWPSGISIAMRYL